ncbi:MAG: OFA family MFS transporter [Nitrospirota bacterium]|nr:OFA family MFS transporter [Nitrospirota bacterium]
MSDAIKNKGPVVAAAGTGINLALGVLYTWSIFKGAIRQSIEEGAGFDWDLASLNDPYAVCCLVFAFAMIVAGRFQDKIGPRKTAIIGGVLVGAGFVWISQTTAYWSWVLGFGVLCGTGIAFGYSAATPAALKWYPPNKTGRISGFVVSGFGLASVYIAPLSNYLLEEWGLQKAMLFFGIAFFFVVGSLANLLRNPPTGYVPQGFVERRTTDRPSEVSVKPLDMLKTRNFWVLWMLYFIGAGAGLMVIGSVAGMAKSSMGEYAFVAVAIMAVGNAGGRIAAGMLSDKIGRKRTVVFIFMFQALMMFSATPAILYAPHNATLLVVLATLIGFNYGANLALFPSFSKDFWGMKSFGVNYGILFTAWGVGGLVMSRLSQTLFAEKGSFTDSLLLAGILLVAGVMMSALIRDRKDELRRAARRKQGAGSA